MKQEMSETAKALLLGADVLERSTWFQMVGCKYRGVDVGTDNCAVTAISADIDDELSNRLINFNDTPGRTKEEVVAYMRELATLY